MPIECTCPADEMPFGRCCKAPTSADVRLICAAPDLLDVLIRMVEYADDGTPIHPTDNLMAEARAVVAQAVGAA